MKTHLIGLACAVIAAAAILSLPGIVISQQQPPSGGAAAQNSSQGTPSASGASGQKTTGQGAQGTANSTQGGSAPRGSGAQDRDAPSSQADRTRQGAADDDTRDASDRPAIDHDAPEPSDRRTTNRIDSSRDDDRDTRDLDTRDDHGTTDRTRTDDRFDRDTTDRDDGRFGDRDDRDGVGDRDDRGDRRGDARDRDIDFGARFDTDSSKRLVVRGFVARGLFGRAGFRDGDVIISINGQRIVSEPALLRILLAADGRVPVIVWRDGSEQTIYVDDVDRVTRLRTPYGYDDELYQTDRAWLGVFLDTRYDNAVVVQSVQEGSAADEAGVRAGDRILSINGRRVQTPSQLSQLIGAMEPGDRVEIDVARWQTRQVEAQLGERPTTSSRFRYLEEGGEPRTGGLDDGQPDRIQRDSDGVRETFRVQP